MHSALEAIRQATLGTPFQGSVWLVGGAVRDELLGRPGSSEDFDLVTTIDAGELARNLYEMGIASGPPAEFARFGTAMVRVQGVQIELVTARKESYDENSRKPDVQPATLEEDANRRDFTINALLRNLHSGELFDPTGLGLADLKEGILRTPLEPASTFRDDPLRMLRAVRFRGKLGFEYAPGLRDAIREEAARLKIISPERIRDELVKMLATERADECLQDLLDLGLLAHFAPELVEMVGVTQGNYHHLDVWGHTLLVLRNAGPDDLAVSLAALFHDIGKPRTRSIDKTGRIRFFTHEVVGAEMTREILRRLRFPGDIVDQVSMLVRNHMRLGSAPNFTSTAARRLLRDLGEDADRLLVLAEADASGHKPGMPRVDLDEIRAKLAEVEIETPRHKLDSPLSGEEIMAATGFPAGPRIGEIKQALVEHVLEGTLAPEDKEGALRLVEKLKATFPPVQSV